MRRVVGQGLVGVLSLSVPVWGLAGAGVFDVRRYGAVSDKARPSTAAIQAAVDACAKAGGGTVRVPAGGYLCGRVRLASKVRLQLDKGATLWQSRRREDHGGKRHLLTADGAAGVEVVGPGTIRGIGEADLGRRRKGRKDKPAFRAGILAFEKCRDVATILLSDAWTLRFRFCRNVTVEDVKIRNNHYRVNSDGIDPVSCRKVRIARCDIVAGDDCIVCKTADGRRETKDERDTLYARLPGWVTAAYVRKLVVDDLRVTMKAEDFRKYPRSALIAAEAGEAAVRNVRREPGPGEAGPPVVDRR